MRHGISHCAPQEAAGKVDYTGKVLVVCLHISSDLALFSWNTTFLRLAVHCIEATLMSVLMAHNHHQHVLPLWIDDHLCQEEEDEDEC